MIKLIISTSLLLMTGGVAHTLLAQRPSDKMATAQTQHLFQHLLHLPDKGYMFGHQDDLAYGVGWRNLTPSDNAGRSDVQSVCGDYPALYGWDLSGIESDHDKDIDGVPFGDIRQYVQAAYQRGGVITFSWHEPSPLVLGSSAWDTTHGTIASILPGGPNHALYLQWLDKVAQFLGTLKGAGGEPIPVLFRPYHELTGSWFWWGARENTPADFIALWQFVHQYLTDVKGIHNLLWVYNTGGEPHTQAQFLERYPGDSLVDIISMDTYQSKDSVRFIRGLETNLSVLDSIGSIHHKAEALAETGYEQIPDAHWWTGVLAPSLAKHRISYVLVWRNADASTGHMHYYAPYPGEISAPDFVQFYQMGNTLFEKDVAKLKLYDAH